MVLRSNERLKAQLQSLQFALSHFSPTINLSLARSERALRPFHSGLSVAGTVDFFTIVVAGLTKLEPVVQILTGRNL